MSPKFKLIFSNTNMYLDPKQTALHKRPVLCCGSGSGRIRIPEGKNDPKNMKKLIKCYPLVRAEGFSCSLYVVYGGLGISKLQFLIKNILIFSAVFFNFWSSKT